MFKGDGFSVSCPDSFSRRIKEHASGRWGYGDFAQRYVRAGVKDPCSRFFFYYWKHAKKALPQGRYLTLLKEISRTRLFTGRHSMRMTLKSPISLREADGFLFKFQFKHFNPKASGPAHFYAFHHESAKRVYVLGILVDERGDTRAERESIAWMEDTFISSFRLGRS